MSQLQKNLDSSKKTQGRKMVLPAQQCYPSSRVLRLPSSGGHPINSLWEKEGLRTLGKEATAEPRLFLLPLKHNLKSRWRLVVSRIGDKSEMKSPFM